MTKPKIIFGRTEYNYDPYDDFWRLVELSGFEWKYIKDIDIAEEQIVISSPLNGEWPAHWKYRNSILKGRKQKCKFIHWNLERPDAYYSGVDSSSRTELSDMVKASLNLHQEYIDYTWVSDIYYASLEPRLIFVVLASDSGLAYNPDKIDQIDKIYDLIHLSYNYGRREPIIDRLGAKFSIAPNAWGDERARNLLASRAMLNIHQTPARIGEPLRFAIAAAYKIALFSETMNDPNPLGNGDFFYADYNDLLKHVPMWLSGNYDLKTYGWNLYSKLCLQWNFRRGVEEGLKKTGFID